MQGIMSRAGSPAAIRTDLGAVFVSLELSRSTWLITSLSPGSGEKMSKHVVRGDDIAGLLKRLLELKERARRRLRQDFPIIVIQEAGLDGFWIHRVLERGEPRVCAMVRVPTPEEEDRRRVSRELKALTAERVRHVNRVKGLLFSQGISGYEPLRRDRRARLEQHRTGDGRPLPDHLRRQINRELDRLELLLEQIKTVTAERDDLLASAAEGTVPTPATALLPLKGIGPDFASVLWQEGLFRHFDNRRQVAAYAGLAPTPWQSGSVDREQGVSKSGNPRLRTTMLQLAWLWLRHQPDSALSRWFHQRVGMHGRIRKVMITALARKLLVAFWRYVTAGVVIEGATMKTA
jgi:transposase